MKETKKTKKNRKGKCIKQKNNKEGKKENKKHEEKQMKTIKRWYVLRKRAGPVERSLEGAAFSEAMSHLLRHGTRA